MRRVVGGRGEGGWEEEGGWGRDGVAVGVGGERDAVSQLRPQLRHCTEPDEDFRKLKYLSVSFPAATATERILGFDVCNCELQCIHQRFLEPRHCQEFFEPHELLTV